MAASTDTTPRCIGSMSPPATRGALAGSGINTSGMGSVVWPSANLALYFPLALRYSYTVARVFIVNGNAVAGNFDIGIYGEDGTKLASTGATAQAGTSALQFVSLATTLAAGSYYLALSMSNTSGKTFAVTAGTVPILEAMGVLQQAAAVPLPASMSAAVVGQAYWPLFGLTRLAS